MVSSQRPLGKRAVRGDDDEARGDEKFATDVRSTGATYFRRRVSRIRGVEAVMRATRRAGVFPDSEGRLT